MNDSSLAGLVSIDLSQWTWSGVLDGHGSRGKSGGILGLSDSKQAARQGKTKGSDKARDDDDDDIYSTTKYRHDYLRYIII